MNFIVVASCLFLLYVHAIAVEGSKTPTTKSSASSKLTNVKETDKLSYPKKVNSSKKNHAKTTSRKKIADISDKFRDLPDDDLAFIKELDKQFRVHGGKVKIKVENKNVTETKNSKRTIEGELGYGYAQNGYNYDQPKYMFYPYSQQNIDKDAPGYFPIGGGQTQVSIEPSYSYELKSQAYVAQKQPQMDVPNGQRTHAQVHSSHHVDVQQQYEEPVIVLRIPGPAKYASHLQMLLQKYLEIRAAQYLHILEEAEYGNLQQQQQLQQLQYGHVPDGHIEEQQQQYVPDHSVYGQQLEYSQQNAGNMQAQQYPEIDHVYHSYKNRHSAQQAHAQAAIQQPESYYAHQQSSEEQHQQSYNEHPSYSPQDHFHYQQPIQQHAQFYYGHQQQYAQPEGPAANSYHQVLLVAMTQPQQADHHADEHEAEKSSQPIYVQDQNAPTLTVPIAENNPRPSHTKVVFTNKNEHPSHDYQAYQLPSIKPNERHAPTSTPDFHQDFHHQPENTNVNYQQQHIPAAAEPTDSAAQPQVVAITQRPYNYHAHNVKARARGRTGHRRRAVTAKEAEKGLEKIREYVRDKLGAEAGSAEEFKTTQIIDA